MSIKTRRAWRMASIPASMGETRKAIAGSLPDALIARCTATEIAIIIDALDAHWHKAVAWAERQACDEGAIWDARRQSLREIERVAV